MDRPALTISQVDRLGKRLRASEIISPSDLELLQRYQIEHLDALFEVNEVLDRVLPDIAHTVRLKSVGTLHDKLRRQPTRLSRVYDIAGARIVRKMGLAEQDELVARIVAAFPGARSLDRRTAPQYGYRAVHVIVPVGGHLAEVQVRTDMQDGWAQLVETLGDVWGRQIRYGGDPDDPEHVVGDIVARRELWTEVLAYGESIATLEAMVAPAVEWLNAAQKQGFPVPLEEVDQRIGDIQRLLNATKTQTDVLFAHLHAIMESGKTL